MVPTGEASSAQARIRPRLFGVAELDNVLADGGVAPGQTHVIEPAAREGAAGADAAAVRRDGLAAEAFALGFCLRSGRPAAWLAPPADLLAPSLWDTQAPAVAAATLVRRIETAWTGRAPVAPQALAGAGCLVAVLDMRRAARLEPALRLARALARRGMTAALLAADAEATAARLRLAAAVWRVGAADEPGETWLVELAREDRVRRVCVRACDASGRLAPAPRLQAPVAKELTRRLARR
ncbi:hypothetical protein ACFFJB_14605 [Camelimonas abortus]|uniref:hypothetical protein n=1 Tax=Camelimonas abortus TaxID=1017184 RepID=UPI0035EF98AB